MTNEEAAVLSEALVLATEKYNRLLKQFDALAAHVQEGRHAITLLLQAVINGASISPQEMYCKIIEINNTLLDDIRVPQHIIDDLIVRKK